jgi:2-polyprenyl-3-methyl-5-hydroxy-6-metoxy-1,4-benzoquinol methylase
MPPTIDPQAYYRDRWLTETKANLWAMSRASAILAELALIGIHNPKTLDFGCGTGWLTEILSQFGEAAGVDLAPEEARRRYPHLSFHLANAVPPGPFDVVVSQEVLEHADDQPGYLDAAYRVLRPGGYLILTTPNAKVSLHHPWLMIQPVEKHLTRSQLKALLLDRGFSILKLYSFFHGYARRVPFRVQMRLGRLLNTGVHLMAVARRA